MKRKQLILLTGPCAVGKTTLGKILTDNEDSLLIDFGNNGEELMNRLGDDVDSVQLIVVCGESNDLLGRVKRFADREIFHWQLAKIEEPNKNTDTIDPVARLNRYKLRLLALQKEALQLQNLANLEASLACKNDRLETFVQLHKEFRALVAFNVATL